MTQGSPHVDATTTNSVQASLRAVAQALATVSLPLLGAAINKDDSTICRVRSGDAKVSIDDAVRLLHAAGLRVVNADKFCVDRVRYEALVTIAAAAMGDPETARRLTLDE